MARQEMTFTVADLRLLRRVRLRDGRVYVRCCPLAALARVAWYIQQHPDAGVSTNELWLALGGLPYTQIDVALCFLADQGCVARRGRRSFPVSPTVYEDALASFHHLAEQPT